MAIVAGQIRCQGVFLVIEDYRLQRLGPNNRSFWAVGIFIIRFLLLGGLIRGPDYDCAYRKKLINPSTVKIFFITLSACSEL